MILCSIVFIIVKGIIIVKEEYNDKKYNNYLEEVSDGRSRICERIVNTNWDEAEIVERFELLKEICEYEKYVLGIDEKLTLRYEKTIPQSKLNKDRLAYFETDTFSIIISKSYLETATIESAVKTICHETFHAFEYILVKEYEKSNYKTKIKLDNLRLKDYEDEFDNYTSGDESPNDYYSQVIEIDARDYAEKRAKLYL